MLGFLSKNNAAMPIPAGSPTFLVEGVLHVKTGKIWRDREFEPMLYTQEKYFNQKSRKVVSM
jgi:hypothetical protein